MKTLAYGIKFNKNSTVHITANRTFSQQKDLIEVMSSFLASRLVKDLEICPMCYKRTLTKNPNPPNKKLYPYEHMSLLFSK